MDEYLLSLSQYGKQELLKCNDYTCRFGLSLSEQGVEELMMVRERCLHEHQRIEFGTGVLDKLIFAFCDSSYIYQGNFVDTLARLMHIFYLNKNKKL